MAGINRIDSTPARLSTNLTVGKQTNATSFGERVQSGLQTAGNVVASGAALIGGAVPGAGPILSTAISSLTHMSGGAGGASTAAYAASSGAINTVGGGGINTTVGASGGPISTGGMSGPNLNAGMSNPGVAAGGTDAIAQMSQENMKMMNVQIAMQRENQMFSSVSNVLKTKHDTVKNSIGNIR